ncbi:LysR family transcriptional regulator [Azohydromonas caseinilytica]|uniref:LysR family transcriptional regulator n=1 Tax=Azohydromonas caseinilytica TaxID=2728836 RepID=A0A848FJR7_9BURK|nr:LysR family transcriptional regulator [Azohydromonas caseinilytica]NML18579.1 LysR family transcriptional regulator [Azohydromonas caseinilytica]
MITHLPLQCFCRVVETGSFAAAARDMDLSRAVVTKYVQQLEDWTASRLLARTTRAMQLTEAGERFYAYCRRVLADTEATLGGLREHQDGPSGRLVVSAPVSMTLGLLAPVLHEFQAVHPAVELEMRLNDHPADLVREGIDVALRGQAQLDDSSLVATPLAVIERVVCAAPAYWQRHGLPATPQQLRPRDCLPYLLATDALRWRFQDAEGGVTEVEVAGRFRTDNSLLLIDALLRGAGVALVPAPLVREPLRDGRLQAALTNFRTTPRTLFAVYPSRTHLPAKVRAFVDFLRERFRNGV